MISSLTKITKLSPNHSGKRTHAVDTITPHCFVGQVTAEQGLKAFLPTSRQASCNYVIGTDGEIGCCVDEDNRSWCSSNRDNDQRAITIEVASDRVAPYAFNAQAYESLINLCVDICKRYKKTKLVWVNNKTAVINSSPKPDEMRITVHRWFANKACPGDWLMNRMGQFADEVTRRLNTTTTSASGKMYKVQVGAYRSKANADKAVIAAKAKGFKGAFAIKAGNIYKVQIGAYKSKANASNTLKSAKAKGYTDAYIVEV